MTTLFKEEVYCGNCGTVSNQTNIGSTNTFGSPDLDTRPAEMERSTICHWIQRCPSCGYSASNISECSSEASAIIKLLDYQNIVNNKFFPDVATSFMSCSYKNKQLQNFSEAAWNAIHAAWICDDKNNDAAARECRLEAILTIEKGKATSQNIANQEGASELITIDLMRRAGMFREALKLAEETMTKEIEEVIEEAINFEIALIKLKDIRAHTISEAYSNN